jgi:hypothetical protein
MAIGTITINDTVEHGGGLADIKCTFAGDSSYPTNGTLVADVTTALELAIKTAELAKGDANVRASRDVTIYDIIGGDCGQYEPYWTAIGLKVLDGGSGTRAEVANGVDLKGTPFNVAFKIK